ncbi:MAG: hypothetical protein V1729_03565 [Candidatus Woesearchaeota archaeon]
MDVYKNHIVFGSSRPHMDAIVKRELGHDRLYKGLISKESYDDKHDIPKDHDLRIVSPQAAKSTFKKICQDTNSDLKIALNYAQTLELFRNMPRNRMPIDVMLLYKLRELDDAGNETSLHDLITESIFPNIKPEEYTNPEEQNPVLLVCYQTLDDAIQHAAMRRKELPEDNIRQLSEDTHMIYTIRELNLPGVMFSKIRGLPYVASIVRGIISKKDKCLQSRGVMFGAEEEMK